MLGPNECMYRSMVDGASELHLSTRTAGAARWMRSFLGASTYFFHGRGVW